jgi:intracellular sulfur oxidation DsrE/DsrF family protein
MAITRLRRPGLNNKANLLTWSLSLSEFAGHRNRLDHELKTRQRSNYSRNKFGINPAADASSGPGSELKRCLHEETDMKFNKSILLALIVATVPLASVPASAGSQASQQDVQEKVVYHINDMSQVRAALKNISNNLNASPDTKIVVVSHGKGIDFLLNDAADDKGPFEPQVMALRERGVTFDVCNNTLRSRGLNAMNVVKEAQVVPSGVAEIVHLEAREGYVYVKP